MTHKHNYRVTFIHDACNSVEVQATTPDEAMALAWNEQGGVTLCHQCSDELEMGDPIRIVGVENTDTGESTDGEPTLEEKQLAKLQALWSEVCERSPGFLKDGKKGLMIAEDDLVAIGKLLGV